MVFNQHTFVQEALDWSNNIRDKHVNEIPSMIAILDEFIRIRSYADLAYAVENKDTDFKQVDKLTYIVECRNRLAAIYNDYNKSIKRPSFIEKLFG